jgi:hypothetical protein
MFKVRDFRDAEMHVPLSQLFDNVAFFPFIRSHSGYCSSAGAEGYWWKQSKRGAAATSRAADLADCCSKPLDLSKGNIIFSLYGTGYAPILRMKKFDS